MSERDTGIRSLHDLGLAAWFGGSLMGAVGLNGAAEEAGGEARTARIASVGWAKWTPVNAAAIAAHLVGSIGLLQANRHRVRYQQGVRASTAVKTVLTGTALAATAYSRVLGKKIELASSPEQEEAAMAEEHPVPLEQAQRQLHVLQWSIPVLTASLVVLNALHGEQQRPWEQKRGMLLKAASRMKHAS